MLNLTPEQRKKRLDEIHSELHDLANSYAIAHEGVIAVELHGVANRILNAMTMVENGPTQEDSDRQIEEWCNNQVMPMGRDERNLIKSLMRERI